MRIRSWFFTVNNYTEVEEKYIKNLTTKHLKCAMVGKEIGEKKTKHLQGFMMLKNAKTMSAMKKFCKCKGIHLEKVRNNESSWDYCKKEGDILLELGERPEQGKRTDLSLINESILNGTNLREIINSGDVNLQQVQFAKICLTYNEPIRKKIPYIEWIFGESGCGKSRKAFKEHPGAYVCNTTDRWWDGYDAHKVVIIDELDRNFCDHKRILRLLDIYQVRVEVKGGFRQLLAEKIIITCLDSPEIFWNKYMSVKEPVKQLLRRITKTLNLSPQPTAGWTNMTSIAPAVAVAGGAPKVLLFN